MNQAPALPEPRPSPLSCCRDAPRSAPFLFSPAPHGLWGVPVDKRLTGILEGFFPFPVSQRFLFLLSRFSSPQRLQEAVEDPGTGFVPRGTLRQDGDVPINPLMPPHRHRSWHSFGSHFLLTIAVSLSCGCWGQCPQRH